MRFVNSAAILIVLLLVAGCTPQTAEQIAPQAQEVPDNAVDIIVPQGVSAGESDGERSVNATAQPQASPPPASGSPNPPPAPLSCTDSDGGLAVSSKGSTLVSLSDGTTQSVADHCATSLALLERTCQGSVSWTTPLLCPNGCDEGRCQPGAASLAQFPLFFQDGGAPDFQIVLGDTAPVQHVQAAVEVATTLTAAFNEPVESKLASEVDDPFARSLLVIGNACENPISAELVGNPSPCSDDVVGEGRIRIAQAGGNTYVFVTGGDATDVRKAARVLARYTSHSLSGTTVRVGGTLENPEII